MKLHLENIVTYGKAIPCHDETYQLAGQIEKSIIRLYQHIVKTRNKEQAAEAVLEFSEGMGEALLKALIGEHCGHKKGI